MSDKRAGEIWEAPYGSVFLVIGEDDANSYEGDSICYAVVIVAEHGRDELIGYMTGVWLPREGDDIDGDWKRLA